MSEYCNIYLPEKEKKKNLIWLHDSFDVNDEFKIFWILNTSVFNLLLEIRQIKRIESENNKQNFHW